jgi:hypothetical protein
MKTKKSAIVSTSAPLELVSRGITSLRDIAEKAIKRGELKEDLSPSDYASLIGAYMKDATGGLRSAVFVAHFAIQAKKDQMTKELLAKTYGPQTVSDIFNTGRNVIPALMDIGAADYRDPHNLRTVTVALLDKGHKAHRAVVRAIKEGKTVTQVRAIRAKAEGKQPVIQAKVVPSLPEAKARKLLRETALALAAIIGGGRTNTFLLSLASEVEGLRPQTSTLQA